MCWFLHNDNTGLRWVKTSVFLTSRENIEIPQNIKNSCKTSDVKHVKVPTKQDKNKGEFWHLYYFRKKRSWWNKDKISTWVLFYASSHSGVPWNPFSRELPLNQIQSVNLQFKPMNWFLHNGLDWDKIDISTRKRPKRYWWRNPF